MSNSGEIVLMLNIYPPRLHKVQARALRRPLQRWEFPNPHSPLHQLLCVWLSDSTPLSCSVLPGTWRWPSLSCVPGGSCRELVLWGFESTLEALRCCAYMRVWGGSPVSFSCSHDLITTVGFTHLHILI